MPFVPQLSAKRIGYSWAPENQVIDQQWCIHLSKVAGSLVWSPRLISAMSLNIFPGSPISKSLIGRLETGLSEKDCSKPVQKQPDQSSDWIKIIQTDPLQGGRLCTAYRISISRVLVRLNCRQDLAAFSNQRWTVFQPTDWTLEMADLLTPSTLKLATWSNLDLGCCILKYGVPEVDEKVVRQTWHRNLLRFPALVL